MTDGVFPDRLTQLRARWEADPASRIFLQLAEEYRHLGRVQDALAVLDKGLAEHPGYLSALVAKGRCHLELADGESARAVLERVVKQDATQMVANKLLVRAFLETGDPVKARERLDLYSLLNDSDPEIEELRRRIRLLEKPARPERPSMDPDPFAVAPPSGSLDVFDLSRPVPPQGGGDDIFALAPPPAAPAPVAAAPPPAVPEPPPSIPVAAEEEPTEELDLIFPGLASRDSRRRYLDALGAEGLFAFEPAASAAPAPEPLPEPAWEPPPPEPEPEPEEGAWLDDAAAAASAAPSAPVLEPLLPPIFAPEPPPRPVDLDATTADELWAEEPAPVFAAEPEPLFAPEPEPVALYAPEPPEPEPVELFVPEPPEPEPVVLPEPEPEPEPVAAAGMGPEEITETATLGELYFLQGHYAEAERIFREVLSHEPGHPVALTGLERLAALGPQPTSPQLDARRLLTGYRRDASRPADVEMRARKTFLLSRYLERLRQGSPHDVS